MRKHAQQQADLEQQLQHKLQQHQQQMQQEQLQMQKQFQAGNNNTNNNNNSIKINKNNDTTCNSTAFLDNVFAESRLLMNNSCANMARGFYANSTLHFSADNSANTSYMTLNENLYKSPSSSCSNNQAVSAGCLAGNQQSLRLLKNIKSLQNKIHNDQF